jgi:N-acetylglutamate synthase-like GNAT family acetyltransferase
MPFTIRLADFGDVPALQLLIAQSAWELCREDYTKEQIQAALQSAWGIDSELIQDRTYFVVEDAGKIIGCGGWSRRSTLFGGDHQPGRQSDLLNPKWDPARIRAFFIHPDFSRKGVGSALLKTCENAARAAGFGKVELVATLPGHSLYSARGYEGNERIEYSLGGKIKITFIPMKKDLETL